ncbi:MAG TPA: DUF1802 family protein [Egibacteraceae bacterium]|nr:DUF1802 family protein [Egibacteraceae bacterium]
MTATSVATTLALKEWAAVAHALLDGRQTLLLRKGGIHEKAFTVGQSGGGFVLFPTVAHSHAERVRPEHADLLARGAADVDESRGTFVVRCGLSLVDVVAVEHPDRLDEVADLHIWTAESIKADRLIFRPRHALQALVVRAVALPEPVTLPRTDAYGGCRSWLDLPLAWDGGGLPVQAEERLIADAARVREAVGPRA